jgi:hypothetical protein
MTFQSRWIGPGVVAAVFAVTLSKGMFASAAGRDLEWILDVAAVTAGGFLIRYGFRLLRKKNMIENVPSSPIRSVAMGLAEIKGQAPGVAVTPAPLSGTPCLYYRYLVEEERTRPKGGREWVTIDRGESNVPFHVEDPTGRILVNPEGADIILGRDYQKIEREGGWLSRRKRTSEWRIDPGDFVYVIGSVSNLRDAVAEGRARLQEKLQQVKRDPGAMKRFDLDGNGTIDSQEWAGAVAVVKDDLLREEISRPAAQPLDNLCIGKGDVEETFVISDRDERSVASSLGWKSFGVVLLGGAGALVMIVSILGRFGVLPGHWTFPWESLVK